MYHEIRAFENYLSQVQGQEELRKIALDLFVRLQDARRKKKELLLLCEALKYQRRLLIQNLDAEGYRLVPLTLHKKKAD